ncbi:MAG: hypothetical protein HC919_09955 [Oscillatoriales cyanobacterium SM2_2_1]|nr:hypothetical protein [Oscillatoriales cyanobacterium SM2_2_1]
MTQQPPIDTKASPVAEPAPEHLAATPTPLPSEPLTVSPTPEPASQELMHRMQSKLQQLWQMLSGDRNRPMWLIVSIITIPAVIIINNVLALVHSIPLLPSLLELVGIGYSVWFCSRYLLLAETRRQLRQQVNDWRLRFWASTID